MLLFLPKCWVPDSVRLRPPQAEKLVLELSQTRGELSRRIAAATDGADAMLANAAGAMNMLNVRAWVPSGGDRNHGGRGLPDSIGQGRAWG